MVSEAGHGQDLPRLPGYTVSGIVCDGRRSRIYRARRQEDGRPVVLKTSAPEDVGGDPDFLTHEYETMRRLSGEALVQAYGLERHGDRPFLVLEDFEGESLDRIVRRRPLGMAELLSIGVQVAEGLAAIHSAGVVHKDINPSNIVYDPDSGAAKIIDFGIAVHLAPEQAGEPADEAPVGSLPYIAPEQTGRMNRTVDYRADFYSLGASLYELLLQRPMFTVEDAVEWLHCHVARHPPAPAEVDRKIPAVLSDIVMRLLAKMPEERYQSAMGIRTDLARCLETLDGEGRIEPFALGSRDVPDRFQIPQSLYGRERQLEQLRSALARAAAGGTEVAVVYGPAGVGKSSLVRELEQAVAERGGAFIAGKFEQFRRNVPYSAVADAFGDLMRQVLSGSEARLAEWRERIRTALGRHGALVTEMVPEVELVVGPQPALPELPPQEAERLFHRTFLNFIRVFCRPEHPLVLFLDDEQWADSASLKLADVLTGESRPGHLLVIGAFRDAEVDEEHVLAHTIHRMRVEGADVEEIALGPLGVKALEGLVADTLNVAADTARPLAELVHAKTAGNPFFAGEFLKLLYRERLIEFDADAGEWRWDLDRIKGQQTTDNVVELLTAKLQRLTPDTRHLLELGACLGKRFPVAVLATVAQRTPGDIHARIREAVAEGVLVPLAGGRELTGGEAAGPASGAAVAFAHDRIQQALYESIDEQEKRSLHLRIGRSLLQVASAEEREEMLLQVVNHLNLGRDLIEDEDERIRLCRLNVEAGQNARHGTAYAAALDYFEVALGLLPPHLWDSDYAFAVGLQARAAEAAFLTARYERMEALVAQGLERADNLLDETGFHEIRIAARISRGYRLEAIELARQVLGRLGVRIPKQPNRLHALAAVALLKWRLRDKSAHDLRHLPLPASRRVQAAARIGTQLGSAAYLAKPELYPLVVYGGVITALARRHSAQPMVYASFAVLLCTDLERIPEAQGFGRLAIDLAERLNAQQDQARASFLFHAFVRPWREPLHSALEPLQDCYGLALNVGDFEYAAHSLSIHGYYAYFSGMHLGRFAEEMAASRRRAADLRQGALAHYSEILRQGALNLLGETGDPRRLVGESYDERRLLPQHQEQGDLGLCLCVHLMKMQLCYLFRDYSEAYTHARAAERCLIAARGSHARVVFYFYDALICLALCRRRSAHRRWSLLRHARAARKRLRAWSVHSPANCLHKLRLVEAERLRTRGRVLAAHASYDHAIRLARDNGFVQEAALAAEAAADMHLEGVRDTIAEPYLRTAHEGYRRWGARAKVQELESRHPRLREAPRTASGTRTEGSTTRTDTLANVDIASLIKALKVISDERVHSRMVASIIDTAIEFAGAQRGVLALRNHKGELCIEAEASLEAAEPSILQSLPLERSDHLSRTVVNYVARTRRSVVVDDAQKPDGEVAGLHRETYIGARGVRSVLCLPILAGAEDDAELIGLLYLENNAASSAFTRQRFGILEIICMAAAGRLELSRRAAIDGLTQLYNHDYFQNMLRQEVAVAARWGRDLSVILADIDHFKQFNDTWGHQAGDAVLEAVARAVKESCREADLAARYGGEEIAVILPETGVDAAAEVADRIREAVAALEVPHLGQSLSVTLSLGVAGLDEETPDAAALIRRADQALYAAKAGGRDRVESAAA